MFSVIIPLYNKAPYIAKALQSVLDQTFSSFEIIIVNDGSTDNSLGVVKTFIDSRIRILDQINSGVSIARNNGVKHAKNEYIAFLDADDWWDKMFLYEMKSLILKFEDAAMYGASYYKVKNGKYIPAKIGVDKNLEKGYINYFEVYAKTLWMPIWTGAVVLKKSVFEEMNGFKPQLKLGEDFDLWVRIALKYPVVFLNKVLAFYNQDVELQNRAVEGKLYEPSEHMLFSDYSENQLNPDFQYLYEVLAVYALLPYYLAGKNKKEVETILSRINWTQHSFKYRLYYRILPQFILKLWMKVMKFGK